MSSLEYLLEHNELSETLCYKIEFVQYIIVPSIFDVANKWNKHVEPITFDIYDYLLNQREMCFAMTELISHFLVKFY